VATSFHVYPICFSLTGRYVGLLLAVEQMQANSCVHLATLQGVMLLQECEMCWTLNVHTAIAVCLSGQMKVIVESVFPKYLNFPVFSPGSGKSYLFAFTNKLRVY
jgi:hypothetical protein